MEQVAAELRLLSDPVRLRALRVLMTRELAAGDLARVLDVAASTISKHLAQLREAGLVEERKDGKRVFVRVPASATGDVRWAAVLRRVTDAADASGDDARLHDLVRAQEEEAEHDAPRADGRRTQRDYTPGRSWTAWARALTFLVPRGLRVVDLGCGDGRLTLEIARFAGSVLGIDRDPRKVLAANGLAKTRDVRNVRFRAADVLDERLPQRSADLVVVSHLLQELAPDEDARALDLARRALVVGGRVLVLDLESHEQPWVVRRLGHQHLGFTHDAVRARLETAGFVQVHVETVSGVRGDPFRVFVATGVRPADAQAPGARRAARGSAR